MSYWANFRRKDLEVSGSSLKLSSVMDLGKHGVERVDDVFSYRVDKLVGACLDGKYVLRCWSLHLTILCWQYWDLKVGVGELQLHVGLFFFQP